MEKLTVSSGFLPEITFRDEDGDMILHLSESGSLSSGAFYIINSNVLSKVVYFNNTSEDDQKPDEFGEFVSNGYKDLVVEDKYLPEIKLNEDQSKFLNSLIKEHDSQLRGYLGAYDKAVTGFWNDYRLELMDYTLDDSKGDDKDQVYHLESSRYYGRLNSFEILDVMKKLVAMEEALLNEIEE